MDGGENSEPERGVESSPGKSSAELHHELVAFDADLAQMVVGATLAEKTLESPRGEARCTLGPHLAAQAATKEANELFNREVE